MASVFVLGLITVPLTPRPEPYRVGNHNPRNVYRSGVDRDTDEHVAVAFTPEMGRLIVVALNACLTRSLRRPCTARTSAPAADATPAPAPCPAAPAASGWDGTTCAGAPAAAGHAVTTLKETPMPDPAPSETLRAAAARLRAYALPGPEPTWEDAIGVICERLRRLASDDGATVAASIDEIITAVKEGVDAFLEPYGGGEVPVSPVVAEPLASMLEDHAGFIDRWRSGGFGWREMVRQASPALAFARSILEQP